MRFLLKEILYNNSIQCKSLLNSSTQCILFPGLSQPLQWAGGRIDSIFSYKRNQGLKLRHQGSENTVHFNVNVINQPNFAQH